MSNLTKVFDRPQQEIFKAITGKKVVVLNGFDELDVCTDDWAKPGLNHVSAHAPRASVREAIARKHRQIRIAWSCAWLATIFAAALFGYAAAPTI